jgi:hypothetical protein
MRQAQRFQEPLAEKSISSIFQPIDLKLSIALEMSIELASCLSGKAVEDGSHNHGGGVSDRDFAALDHREFLTAPIVHEL